MNNSSNITSCYTFETGYMLQARFIMVCVLMSIICFFGIYGNLMIVLVLTRPRMRSSTSWYLVVLSIVDTSLMVCTVLLYVVEFLYDYLRNYSLYIAWFSYVRGIYFLSHVSQDTSIYLTIAATVERFLSLWFPQISQLWCADYKAFFWMLGLMPFILAMTLTKYWEIVVVYVEECKGHFGYAHLDRSDLLKNEVYQTVHSVYLSSILFCFLPFAVMATLNWFIYVKLRNHHRKNENETKSFTKPSRQNLQGFASLWVRRRRFKIKRSREASLVLFGVALTFLICNIPSVLVSAAEHISPRFFMVDYPNLYTFARDLINLLTVVNSSSNFVIYLACGVEFRKELRQMNCIVCQQHRKAQDLSAPADFSHVSAAMVTTNATAAERPLRDFQQLEETNELIPKAKPRPSVIRDSDLTTADILNLYLSLHPDGTPL